MPMLITQLGQEWTDSIDGGSGARLQPNLRGIIRQWSIDFCSGEAESRAFNCSGVLGDGGVVFADVVIGWKYSVSDCTAQRPIAGVSSAGCCRPRAGCACTCGWKCSGSCKFVANSFMRQRLLLAISTDKRDEVVLLVKAGVSLDITVSRRGKGAHEYDAFA
ncbi:unnamed protein product [Phytophthora fragariaefolia]|uniref:Unnamed protein product n=1 Tax=Phytophthora fragariaefolia TaxID=1490495 RepID=A0A9W7CUB3_9STRA|nr:unnamed protein product [Phytophthora fragariaefolia]